MKFPIAIQLYSVRDEMEKDFYGTLKRIKELGYDGVEFAGLFGEKACDVKKALEELELVPVSAHVPYYDMLNNPEEVLADYKEIGCKYVAVPYLTEECRPGTDGFDDTVKGIRKIGEAAKKLGLQLLYHNHDFEFVKIDGKYALDILYDTIPDEFLQTEIDTCWVNVGGENPADYIVKYTGKSPVVHLKDFSGSKGNGPLYKLIGIDDEEDDAPASTFEFRPVGYGVQNFGSILNASEKAGAEWVVVEQDEPSMGKTSLECAMLSINYIKSISLTRSEAREQAFLVMFEKIFDAESTIGEIIEKAEENNLVILNEFSKYLLSKYEPNEKEIDALIDEKTTGWALSRLPKVSLAVLRLAVTEIKYCDDIPAGVAINEAVEIYKKYGTPEDASYVNGVLGSVARS